MDHLTSHAPTLLPCPFCGGDAQLYGRNSDNAGGEWGVKCTQCPCHLGLEWSYGGLEGEYSTSAEAIIEWCRRFATRSETMQYKLIENTDINEFQKSVNSALSEGWKLQGGVSHAAYYARWHNSREGIDESEEKYSYVQSLTKATL